MERKLRITELTEYLVRRYELPEKGASLNEAVGDGMAGYRRKVERILRDTQIAGMSLYDICKPKAKEDNGNESGSRRISISDFEKYCFDKWYKYVKKLDSYNAGVLDSDYHRLIVERSKQYYIDEAKKAIDDHNKAFENDNDTDYMRENHRQYNYPLDSEVERSALRMMIEGIFEVFYEPFDWRLFDYDVKNYPEDTGYNPDITPEMIQSMERLKSVYSYTRRRDSIIKEKL